jgi:putative SOS response-associated peptidase YedK
MCERYVIPDQAEVEREFDLDHCWWRFSASFNVGTTRNVPVIRMHKGESEGVMMRWGLVPAWAEGDASKGSATHAAMEDLGQAKLFRDAWWWGQRCILPLSGFYGWQLTDAGYRQPYFVRLVNRSVFGVAAVWDRSVCRSDDPEDDEIIESCALITVPPNPLMAEIHNTSAHMPAILHRDDYDAWLTAQPTDARVLLRTYPQERMVSHPVSPRVNSPKYDDEWLIRPISAWPNNNELTSSGVHHRSN